MTYIEFCKAFSKSNGISYRQGRMICDSVFYFLAKTSVSEDEVAVRGLGTFMKKKHLPYRYMNVHTREYEISPVRWKLDFQPAHRLRLDGDGNPVVDFSDDEDSDEDDEEIEE